MTPFIRRAAALAVQLSCLASAANAQTTQPPSASHKATVAQRAEHREDLVAKRINELHMQLKITPAQAPRWNAFAQTMRGNAEMMEHAFHERMLKLPTMSAVETMRSYAAIAQMNAENMQKLSASFSDLYAEFSPEQKAIADKLFRNQPQAVHKAMPKK